MKTLRKIKNQPVTFYLLALCLIFLSLGGLYGGLLFVSDPSGNAMGMATDALKPLSLNSYLLPGLFLLIVYAAGPLVVLYGLWVRLRWALLTLVALNVVLLGWLMGEVIILNLFAPISVVLAVLAVMMLILAVVPSTRKYYGADPA